MKKIIAFLIATAFFVSPFSASAFQVTLVSDIHMGVPNCTTYRCGPKAESALQKVLDETGDSLIITAGDNTDASSIKNKKKAIASRKASKEKLLSLVGEREVLWANGNHDRETYLSGREYYSYDKDNWRIIVIHTTEITKKKKQYNWLVEQLKTDKKIMVVMHHPIFNRKSHKLISGYKKIEKLFSKNKVQYVLSGHWHEDNWTRVYNGVTYKALHGLTYENGVHYETMNLE